MPSADHDPKAAASRYHRWSAAIFLSGTAIHAWLLSRSWLGEDQVYLLKLGQDFASSHVLSPMSKGMSGGGSIPGSGLQFLVGLPLLFWQDYRAPLILIGLLTLLSGVVILSVLRKWEDPLLATIFFAIYWLSPWRLYHASILWEPAFLFLPVALAFWAAFALREQKSFWPSLVYGAVLSFTPQLHGSFLWLWLLTAILIWKKQILVDWWGISLGVVIGALTFIPMILATLGPGLGSSSFPKEGFIGSGFLLVYPVLKGALYWLRLPSLDLGVPLKEVVYFDHWATAAPEHIFVFTLRLLQILSTATIAIVVCCYWSYWKMGKKKQAAEHFGRLRFHWPERYAACGAIALLLSAGFAPVTLQGWHVVIALHAAVIPLAFWIRRRWHRGRIVKVGLMAGLVLGVCITLVVGIGKPSFRKVALPSRAKDFPSIRALLPEGIPYE